MPLSRRIARFNKHGTNRLTMPVAGRLPGFAIVSHVGRRSGRAYRTPVNVFRHGDQYVFALTYGSHSDWVRNVRAAGRCEVQVNGRRVELADPELLTDATRRLVPIPPRWVLGLIGVDEFPVLTPPHAAAAG